MYTLQNCKKRKTVTTTIAVTWSSHHTEKCATCLRACKQVVGGRPKKHVQPGKLKTVKTIEDVYQIDPSKPIPPHVEKMMSHLLTIKMDQSKLLNKSVQFSRGGPQPLTLTPVTLPRKESDCASKRTKYDRSKRIRDYIRLSSGDGDEAFTTQTAHVVKSLDETTRKSIVSNLNIKTTIPAEHVVAMKVTQNIPWNLLEEVRRWLATFNVKLSTKNKVREVAKEWVGQGLKCEYAPLLITNNEEVRSETNTMVLPI